MLPSREGPGLRMGRTSPLSEGSSSWRDLPHGEGAPDMRTHDLTLPSQVPAPEQGDQAVPVGVPLAMAAVLDRNLPLGVCGGLVQQALFFGCHCSLLCTWLLSASGVVGLSHATRPATRALSRALPRRRALCTT